MRRFFRGRVGILASALFVVLLIALLITVSVAWFYLPTTLNITIFTDINYEIDVDLYEYRNEFGSWIQAGLNENEDTIIANNQKTTTFVEWGGEFYPTASFLNYYMLVLTYPDSNFLNGQLNADLNMELFSGMHDNGDSTSSPNAKILYTKISYAVAQDANLDPLVSTELITQARAAVYSPLFESQTALTPGKPPDFMNEDHLSISLLNLLPAQYAYVTPLDTQCRLILFVRIESDASNIAASIASNNIDVDVVQIITNNIYKFSCNFRSIPFKTDRIGFKAMNCMIDDKSLVNSHSIYDKKELQERLV